MGGRINLQDLKPYYFLKGWRGITKWVLCNLRRMYAKRAAYPINLSLLKEYITHAVEHA
jgi:hypothetical protein